MPAVLEELAQKLVAPPPSPPPPSRTNRTRLVPPPVLTGHVSSLLQDLEGRGAPGPPELSPVPLQPDAVTASLGFASPRG